MFEEMVNSWCNSASCGTITDTSYKLGVPQWKEYDCGKSWYIPIQAPGASKENFEVKLRDYQLEISFDGNNYRTGFDYIYKLPRGVEGKHISAKYESGILTIDIQKPEGYEKVIPIG